MLLYVSVALIHIILCIHLYGLGLSLRDSRRGLSIPIVALQASKCILPSWLLAPKFAGSGMPYKPEGVALQASKVVVSGMLPKPEGVALQASKVVESGFLFIRGAGRSYRNIAEATVTSHKLPQHW